MCGRFSQVERMEKLLVELDFFRQVISYYDPEPLEHYNIAPTARAKVLREARDGLHIDTLKWGWAPAWASGKRPSPINARVETVASGRFFRQLWPDGRVLVPANGWYEWVADPARPNNKQPYYIRLKSQAPMFFAGLAQAHPGIEPDDSDGFVIITDASDAGMVDIHDRRPVVLAPQQAREWLQPGLPAARAEELARCGRTAGDFEWYPVGKAVGNVRNHGPGLIEPLRLGGGQQSLF